MSWIPYLAVVLAGLGAVHARRHYAGGHGGHYEDQGIYCNYYTTDPIDGSKVVGSVLCRYGCCGTLDDQSCCSKGADSDEDDDRPSGGKSVTFVLIGLLSMGALVILLSCALWWYKHSKAKRCKTYHSDRPRNRTTGRGQRGPTEPTAPPKYSLTPGPGHMVASGPNYELFTVGSPPPAYSAAVPGGPPSYQLQDLPPYSPKEPGNIDGSHVKKSTCSPPPYSVTER